MDQLSTICKNPWCKARFFYTEVDMETNQEDLKIPPSTCKKCRSFASELSGGVEWVDRQYPKDFPESRYRQIKYKETNYRQ